MGVYKQVPQILSTLPHDLLSLGEQATYIPSLPALGPTLLGFQAALSVLSELFAIITVWFLSLVGGQFIVSLSDLILLMPQTAQAQEV